MKWFDPSEYLCKCGRPECDAPKGVSPLLDRLLNTLRDRVGYRLTVTSGLRCAFWNDHEGGEKDSEHLTGEAADIAAPDSASRYNLIAANFADGPPLFTRYGIGKTFLHFGISRTLPNCCAWTYYPK